MYFAERGEGGGKHLESGCVHGCEEEIKDKQGLWQNSSALYKTPYAAVLFVFFF